MKTPDRGFIIYPAGAKPQERVCSDSCVHKHWESSENLILAVDFIDQSCYPAEPKTSNPAVHINRDRIGGRVSFTDGFRSRSEMFLFRVVIVVIVLFAVVSGEDVKRDGDKRTDLEFTPRMPMHKTDGIFDIFPPRMILNAVGRSFMTPLRYLKMIIKPILFHLRTVWSWVGPGTTVPGMTLPGGRSNGNALDWISDENIDRFFQLFGVWVISSEPSDSGPLTLDNRKR